MAVPTWTFLYISISRDISVSKTSRSRLLPMEFYAKYIDITVSFIMACTQRWRNKRNSETERLSKVAILSQFG